ncbi:MAG TPA: tRNA (guanosine(46)-N7)-methyltransferase TrmB [Anaerolineae bacterium]|nr:tRNA (guanosine(46)-N7)-methyltransferase TrmB [Anaerolineae bacterium]
MIAHAYQATKMEWPVDWEKMFGRQAPLGVEIGFGSGNFLVNWAQERPDWNLVGIEISLVSVRKAESKVRGAGLENVCVVQGSAQLALWALFGRDSIGQVYINFPDPWHKDRHHHRRLIQPKFLELLASRVQVGAELNIATDHAEYATFIEEVLASGAHFESRDEAAFVLATEAQMHTKYERIGFEEGRRGHYFRWRRRETAVADDVYPLPKEWPMPHMTVQLPLSLSQVAFAFEPQLLQAGERHIRLLSIFESHDRTSLLVEINVTEEPLAQRVGVVVQGKGINEYLISVHEMGFPRPTSGLHDAVRAVGEWMVGLHSEGEILKDNLRPWGDKG